MIDGKINERQKGIKEIQIAAAWLRGIAPRDIDEIQKTNRPILKVYNDNNHSEVGGLRFEMFIKKSKEVLIVSQETISDLPDSWASISWTGLKSVINTTQYNFVLFDSRGFEEDGEAINLLEYAQKENISLPVRHLSFDISKIEFGQLTDNIIRQKVEVKIYATWLDEFDRRAGKVNEKSTKNLKIGIQDDKITSEMVKDVSCIASVGTTERELVKSKENLDIIHRRHNDTNKEFKNFQIDYNPLYNKARFIEGISGNNSTSRILRDEPKTSYWCKKMQESATCRVMIIDERIWKETIFPKKDGSGFNSNPVLEFDRTTKKQIYIYTIRGYRGDNDNESMMELVNLKNERVGTIKEDGKIYWENMPPNFHFVSFHQGLLDKIFNYFKIYSSKGKNDFFDNLKKTGDAALRYYFHSGRSFTPELPENTGFIPLSSIDVAMRDCKYRLTELLFSGALVKINNNG